MVPARAWPEVTPNTAMDDGDGELEVVAGGGEGDRGVALVVEAEPVAERERAGPHDREVDEQWYGDAGDVEGWLVICSPWRAKSTTMVNSRP